MMETAEARHAKVVEALHTLTGYSFPPGIDEEEGAVLARFRDIRRLGFGRMEVIVVGHHLDTLHHTTTLKRKDLLPPQVGRS